MDELISISLAVFGGWLIGGAVREKRLRKQIEREQCKLYADAATKVVNKEIERRDNLILRGMWVNQKEYIKIMIDCIDKGFTIEEMRTMFEAQIDIVNQELALEETKTILL